jgi:hypothetical protein
MISLAQMRVPAVAFPPLSCKAVRKASIADEIEMTFFKENVELSLQADDAVSLELRDALRACMRRHELRRLLKDLDRVLFRGTIKRVYRGIMRGKPGIPRIGTTPARS